MLDIIEEMKLYGTQFSDGMNHLIKNPDRQGKVYNDLFAPFCDKKIRLLEIGVYRGASMMIWKKYFGDNGEIFGIDRGDLIYGSIDSVVDFKGVGKIYMGDQSHKPFMNKIAKELAPLDIIIDDGGHWSDEQQISFEALWPVLNSGGIYVIEDLACAEERHTDGYANSIEYFEKLPIRKEWYPGFMDFEKDMCVLYKE